MAEKKVYDISVEDGDEKIGIYAVSFVDQPAIESDYIFMHKVTMQALNEERRMVYGPILVPEKLILRVDQETKEEYYIRFKADVIRKLAHRYMEQGLQNNATVMHEHEIGGCVLVEQWIKEGAQDKSIALGLEEMPDGTLFQGRYVEDDALWQRIKAGELRGFSIEAVTSVVEAELSMQMAAFVSDLEALLLEHK